MLSIRTFPSFKKYGIYPSEMISSLQTQFHIPIEKQHALSYYQLLYWSKEYFFSRIQNGCIIHNDHKFNVIYLDSRSRLLLSQSGQVKLSFRAATEEFGFEPYVLVKDGA
jgi:hypothetical protein